PDRAAGIARGDAPRARGADARDHRQPPGVLALMASTRLFGTDGVRGTANIEPMTAETALRLGRALAYVSKRSPRRHKILIGKDTRLSGYMLEQAMASGICSMGVDVLLVGPLPTPGIAFLTRSLRADAGAVISASHNPFQDNGIKFFAATGFKLPADGENINRDCGALHPERLARTVVESRSHLGIALDGDADRAILVDETGSVVDGDEVLTMAAAEMLKQERLAKKTVVATVMSNLGLDLALEKLGGRTVRTPVGDRYVVEEMLRGGYNLGGEQSGHVVFLDQTTTGDGLITALFV